MSGQISRRAFLAGAIAAAGAAGVAGCGAGTRPASLSGSTLESTWGDPEGDGQLRALAGEPLIERTELGPSTARVGVLATLAHVTDAHVLDASSPARVPFLDRLGRPFTSTFRPQEALTVQVLAGAVTAVRALGPDLVIQGGDLIDNDQHNELSHAESVLSGGLVRPGSGPLGYYGVQLASNPDPFYYRPALDAPQHPGLLRAAIRPFRAAGLGRPSVHVLGDHDILVAGELTPTPLTRALAVADRALWDLPPGLRLPPGLTLEAAAASPDGPPAPGLVDSFLRDALAGPTVAVPADPSRRELAATEVLARLKAATRAELVSLRASDRLDYVVDVADRLRLLVLDLARRGGGSGGLVVHGQAAWLSQQLALAGERWVIVVSHQPLASSEGGAQLIELLDRAPRVIATLCGHTHRNRIAARPSPSGGYWQIETASLIDYPQQARALRVVTTSGGGVAIETWMLDHVQHGSLGEISRELAYLDAQGGRPQGFHGRRLDRNVILYRRRGSMEAVASR